MRRPNSVRWVRFRSRRKSSWPNSCSSCLTARVREGCATLHSSAARVKLSSLAVARKYRTWCISIGACPCAKLAACRLRRHRLGPYCYRTIPQTLFQLRAQPLLLFKSASDIYSSMPTYSLKGSCAAPSARRHRMKELTLSQILDEAFERSRDLDAPLSVRLESFADSVRIASPVFAEVV